MYFLLRARESFEGFSHLSSQQLYEDHLINENTRRHREQQSWDSDPGSQAPMSMLLANHCLAKKGFPKGY